MMKQHMMGGEERRRGGGQEVGRRGKGRGEGERIGRGIRLASRQQESVKGERRSELERQLVGQDHGV